MKRISKWIMAIAVAAGMSAGAEVVVQSFTSTEGFTSGNLNGQKGCWLAKDWINDALVGSAVVSTATKGNDGSKGTGGSKAICTEKIVLPPGGSITLRTDFHLLGTPVTPTADQVVFSVGFLSAPRLSASGLEMNSVTLRLSQSGKLELRSDLNTKSLASVKISDFAAANLAVEYTLTLGTLAANSTFSAKLINLSTGTETPVGSYTGLDEPVFAAATTTGICSFFSPLVLGGDCGVTGISVDQVTVIKPQTVGLIILGDTSNRCLLSQNGFRAEMIRNLCAKQG